MTSNTQNIKVGMIATFGGYSDLEEGMEAILPEGQRIVIADIKPNGAGYTVVAINEEGQRLNADGEVWKEGDAVLGDTLFPSEILDIEDPIIYRGQGVSRSSGCFPSM
jgi:hypothetical protein